MWGEMTRVENRGETTWGGNDQGGNILGAKRLVTDLRYHISRLNQNPQQCVPQFLVNDSRFTLLPINILILKQYLL